VSAPGPRPRGHRRRRRGPAPALLAILVSVLLVVPPTRPASAASVNVALSSAEATTQGAWAIVAMGRLHDPDNTFWQLFFDPPGFDHWTLVTPPGVADNGGLVATVATAAVTVGILPSQLLGFSPLAQSTDNGTNWNPQFFPTALASVPDALAVEGTGPGTPGRALAVTEAGRVLSAPASIAAWSPLTSVVALGRFGLRCGVVGISAVAVGTAGAPVLGTACHRGGQVGVFTQIGDVWQSIGPTLSGPLAASSTTVLRLVTSGGTTTALVRAATGRTHAVVALWRTSGSWSLSAPLVVPRGSSILSSALGPAGQLVVLVGTAQRSTPVMISRGGMWLRLPPPPARVLTLALTTPLAANAPSDVAAFSVHGSQLRVFALTPSASKWVRVQSSQVPIAYGSSS